MAMYQKRIEARKMRRQGASISEIQAVCAVSKKTASVWCGDISLSDSQKEKIIAQSHSNAMRGRLMGAATNKQKKIDAILTAEQFARNSIRVAGRETLLLVGAALYWAEGSKSVQTFGFQFINSDPDMILCVKQFLIELGVKHEDLCCTVQINEVHKPRIKQVLKFWQKLLELSDDQIGNPSFVRTKVQKVYDNYDTYFGICRLKVRRSTYLKYQVLGLIKAMKADILSR